MSEAPGRIRPDGMLIVEISPDQVHAVTAEAMRAFPSARVRAYDDLMGLARAVAVEVPLS